MSSGSNPYGHGSSCHPWQHPDALNVLFARPCLSTLFEKISTPSDRHRGMTFRPPWAFCVLKIPWKNTESISCYWFLYSSKVIYILNSCFQILYMCFLERFTYLFSILAYCACVFPVIIHAGSLFLALKHVFSDLLYIPNYDFWIIRMYFLLYCTYLIPVFNFRACILKCSA